jgi:hypothetical protein
MKDLKIKQIKPLPTGRLIYSDQKILEDLNNCQSIEELSAYVVGFMGFSLDNFNKHYEYENETI